MCLAFGSAKGKGCQSQLFLVSGADVATDIVSGGSFSIGTTYYMETPSSGSLQLKWRAWGDYCYAVLKIIKNSNELIAEIAFVPAGSYGYNYFTLPGEGHYLAYIEGTDDLRTIAVIIGTAPSVSVEPHLVLGGAYETSTGLMRDELRSGGHLPFTAGGLPWLTWTSANSHSTSDAVSISGPEAIVDWITVELWNAAGLKTYSTPAFAKRNGEVTGNDGNSMLVFPAETGTYRLVFRHRNHLPIATELIELAANGSLVLDLMSVDAPVHGLDPRMDLGTVMALWPGDTRQDGNVKYTSSYNDRDPILQKIGGSIPTNVAFGYEGADVNLDGVVKYTGANNDRDVILQSIGGSVPTAVRTAQLP
jgi:hypothetical protein